MHYKCENPDCGKDLDVDASMAGRPAECPHCHNIQNVPLPDYLPRLTCPYCEEHEWVNLVEDDAGTMVKCPKCMHTVRVPGASKGCSFTAAFLILAGISAGTIVWSLLP
jgi:DNA-directed RNA polymerase subunit RPC12/RpoP